MRALITLLLALAPKIEAALSILSRALLLAQLVTLVRSGWTRLQAWRKKDSP